MVVETDVLPYWDWLLRGSEGQPAALLQLVVVVAAVSLLALLVGYLVAAVRHGPMVAGDMTYRVVVQGLAELPKISLRRVNALARLAFQEARRRRVTVALLVFLVILLFASWFLGTDYPEPARLYLSFVITATSYLTILIALFMSAFSLPTDIKNKTIYTIVTKPVRASEILLGRIVGFTAMGTLILVVMGIASYIFVVRSLDHTHQVDVLSLTDEVDPDSGQVIGRTGRTSDDSHHHHDLSIPADVSTDQPFRTGAASDHWHGVQMDDPSGETQYAVSGPYEMFDTRVPIYGKLRFKDRQGKDAPRGINTGNEWQYRTFVEGRTQAAAIWTLGTKDQPLLAEDYPDGLPLELIIRVFRSHKGEIERGISGSIVVKRPVKDPTTGTRRSSEMISFTAKDAYIDSMTIPRGMSDAAGEPIDLFKDLVHDGRVEMWIQCLEPGQYFGVAQADVYIRAADGTFSLNFAKGFVSLWIQMVLVISLGVMCSTFLSGPVAMLFTLSIMVLGFFREFILKIAMGELEGGGPLESLVRLVTQKNMVSPLDEGAVRTTVETVDAVLLTLMQGLARVIPDFRGLSTVDYVAEGFDIPKTLMAENLSVCLAYVVGTFVVGYFFFRTREVAK